MDKKTETQTIAGHQITFREITEADTSLLVDLWNHLSHHTRRLRFHNVPKDLPMSEVWWYATDLTTLDPARQVAIAALVHDADGDHVVGVSRLSRAKATDTVAEAAVVVRDDFQQMGLGSRLMRLLGKKAWSMGITHFEAWVMAENDLMLNIIAKLGYPATMETRRGETHVLLDIGAADLF